MARKETRYLIATELRVGKEAGKPSIEGYAAVFNSESQDLGGFLETVAPGAFKRALDVKSDVRALVNHDPSLLLARTKSGTLKLWEDQKGLKFRAVMPDTQYARDVYTSIERGDMDQCSFSFKALKQTWGEKRQEDGSFIATRQLDDVDVYDVSAVTYPAYEETSVVARSRWADAVPAEVRSLIEAIESRVYSDKKDVPDYVPESKAAQWMEVWNSAYKAALKDGKSKEEAEKSAFAQANGVAGPHADKNAAPAGEKRDEDSFEESIGKINAALQAKFGNSTTGGNWQKYSIVETFEDYVIVSDWDGGGFFKVAYTHDESKPEGQEITLGDLELVEKEWVPSERGKKFMDTEREKRGLKKVQWPEVSIPGKLEPDPADTQTPVTSTGHRDDGDCESPDCECQNCLVDESEASDFETNQYGDPNVDKAEKRADKKVRTKKVGGKNLTAKSFAFVGDPDRTETWKLPIHDEAHARNALARFNQTQGIPADKKAGVYRKIVAAAKKFGIEVSDEGKGRMLDLELDEANRLRAAQLEKELAAELDFRHRRYADDLTDDENRCRIAELA